MPESMHRKLKARAAQAGLSFSDYLLQELSKVAEQPTLEEMLERLLELEPVQLSESPAAILREERDRR